MQLTGAEIICECLIEQGVDTVFGYPGGAALNTYDALYKYSDKINHILTAHEQGASHAADGYARATGKVGVCMTTSGPGATNTVTGIATANIDSIPMVIITGNVNVDLLGRDSFQEVDIVNIVKPITKGSYLVKKIEDLAPAIRTAFMLANEGRKGPVLIDVPKDITAQKTEFEPLTPPEKKSVEVDNAEKISQAVELINKSKFPMIYAGGGVISSNASKQLVEFAEKSTPPFAVRLWDLAVFPRDTALIWEISVCTAVMKQVWQPKNATLLSPAERDSPTGLRAIPKNSERRQTLYISTLTKMKLTKTYAPIIT